MINNKLFTLNKNFVFFNWILLFQYTIYSYEFKFPVKLLLERSLVDDYKKKELIEETELVANINPRLEIDIVPKNPVWFY